MTPRQGAGPGTALFDRFESARPADLTSLARDVADVIGARRTFRGAMPGLLGWGLPDLVGYAPSSARDQAAIASLIAALVERFEPRLTQVRVTPVEGTTDFTFTLDAVLVQGPDESVTLRVLSPRRGGGLGADIRVVGGRT